MFRCPNVKNLAWVHSETTIGRFKGVLVAVNVNVGLAGANLARGQRGQLLPPLL